MLLAESKIPKFIHEVPGPGMAGRTDIWVVLSSKHHARTRLAKDNKWRPLSMSLSSRLTSLWRSPQDGGG